MASDSERSLPHRVTTPLASTVGTDLWGVAIEKSIRARIKTVQSKGRYEDEGLCFEVHSQPVCASSSRAPRAAVLDVAKNSATITT
jgi:hypothetical protein